MKIAYGTYAMPTVPLEEALPALAEIGYDGVEICISPTHVGSSPPEMDAARRAALRTSLLENRLSVPALFFTGSLWTRNPAQKAATKEQLRTGAQLARDLAMPDPPVLAMGIGGQREEWEDIKEELVALLREYGQVAGREGFLLAAEAHFGAAVYNVERAVWLFETLAHPHVKLHFDIVHMFLSGSTEAEAVKALVPYTAHTHLTDAIRNPDGTFQLVLLGQGELDATAYMRAMKEAGWKGFITLEVSRMVWGQTGYDPFAAAKFSYASITKAFGAAGVERG
ncbi:MAG: sugar phosphate isomerase/epimerase family protein [Candidatus Zipacnadales bacterium]